MIVYLVLGAVLLGAILPSLTAPHSHLRLLRDVLVLVFYPLFVVIAAVEGLTVAVLLWLGLTGVALVLILILDRVLPQKDPPSWPTTIWKTTLLWPLVIPAVSEALLIHGGLAPKPPPIPLPEPPRGAALFDLPDDELLVAVYQLLAGVGELTGEEKTIWLAEGFSREMYGGGFVQWFRNSDSSVPETAEALRTVGAPATATLLQQAGEPTLRSFDAAFFSLQKSEDLTSLIARFVRQNRARCPTLGDVAHGEDA